MPFLFIDCANDCYCLKLELIMLSTALYQCLYTKYVLHPKNIVQFNRIYSLPIDSSSKSIHFSAMQPQMLLLAHIEYILSLFSMFCFIVFERSKCFWSGLGLQFAKMRTQLIA